MATQKEINQHVKLALAEIGAIKPRFRKRFNAWIFSHSLYPEVEYAGDSPEDVIKNYPRYLRQFIKERLNQNISALAEKKTKGRGGKREGAGRPKGSRKEPTRRVSLPKDIADYFQNPESIPAVRALIAREEN